MRRGGRRLVRCGLPLLVSLVALGPTAAPAASTAPAEERSPLVPEIEVTGHVQLWLTVFEQMEEASELFQHPSRDEAATSTTGFSLNRARLGARLRWLDGRIGLAAQLRLERNADLLDLYLDLHPTDWLAIYLGQLKIPSAWENLEGSRALDFILRPVISDNLVDFALARTTYPSSLFYGTHAYLRDLGLAVKGDWDLGVGRLRAFVMASNGLGANLAIGGAIQRQYIITNAGQLCYGARLELADLFEVLTVGGHVNYNRHDDMVFNSGRVVYDLDRLAASGDLRVWIPGTGVRLAALYGAGVIDDDYDADGRTDLAYSGWEGRLVWNLRELLVALAGSSTGFIGDHGFELGVRFERFVSEWNESTSEVRHDRWTLGINYLYRTVLKAQLNWIRNDLEDPSLPALDDDALLLSVQGAF